MTSPSLTLVKAPPDPLGLGLGRDEFLRLLEPRLQRREPDLARREGVEVGEEEVRILV